MMTVHRDAATTAARRRPQSGPARPRSGPVEIFRVNRVAWLTALGLAGGDAHRLTIVDANTVIVGNFADRVRIELHEIADSIEVGDVLPELRARLRGPDRTSGDLSSA